MTVKTSKQDCLQCNKLAEKIAQLEVKIAQLESKLAKAQKNSSNSSKPPSSDIVNPQPKTNKNKKDADEKRKPGGQPGHQAHQRKPFEPEEIDFAWIHYYEGCPCCGGQLEETDSVEKVFQQIELKSIAVEVHEHRRQSQHCSQCQQDFVASWPADLVAAGLTGPRLTALVGYLKSACHMSFSSIRKFLRDVAGVTLSRGLLRKLVAKVADSLEDPYQQLLDLLPLEERLHVDETGHKDNGKRLWTWCFRAALYTVYKISPSRGSDVLLEVLGEEFKGVLGCDYFSAYRKYMRLNENVAVQFCLAHLIRDVKFLATHPHPDNRELGELLLEHLRALFHTIHCRQEYRTEKGFRNALARIRNRLLSDALWKSPDTREADNLNLRFMTHCESYFRFITTPDVEPTNNLAEQAIRFVAIHRRMTQGTRGEAGQTWCERIWTAVTTCVQQGRSLFDYLVETVQAHFGGQPAPSLLLDSS